MSHLAIVLVIVGAFILILGTVMADRAYLKNRGEAIEPFRDYFGPEYDRDLLRQSSWSDNENLYDRGTYSDAFNISDSGATER
jgi:hypothetical protein